MTDTGQVVDLLDLDAKIHQLRLAGLSIRRLSREFNISETRVLESLDRSLPRLSQELKIRLYREDLSRLDEMLQAFWPAARNGSSSAAQTCIKLLERRASMVGSDAPQRVDVIVQQIDEQQPNSTEILMRELRRIANERQPAELVVESEEERNQGIKAVPPPEPPEAA